MTKRTILIRGELTDDELLDIVAVVQRIEQTRPDEDFQMVVDDPETDGHIDKILSQIPLHPGYGRAVKFFPRGETGAV